MVAASVFAARTMPLWPIDMPPAATTGQACQGTPRGAVVTDTCRVGTFQLTSPTSVEPPSWGCPSSEPIVASIPTGSTPAAFCSSRANASSSGV